MKTKVVALLLCIILCLGLCVPALGAYNDDVTVSAALDQAKLDYDADSDRTVTLTVTLSKEVGLYSVYFVADVPSELTLESIDSDIPLASRDYSLKTGVVSWFDGENNSAKTLATLTVTVPAGTAAGSYKIGVKEIELATAGENDDDNWMEGESAYATLTIEDAAPISYTVSFNAGGGSGSMSAKTVNEGEKLTLPECKFTAPEGKQFKAWAIGSSEYDAGDKVTITSDITVKAVWEDIPVVTYTVTFAANGGSGSMSAKTINEGEKLTLPECKFTAPDGKQFKAWAIGSSEYDVGDKVTITADTTVKALWEDIPAVTYTVSFSANGGSGSMSAKTVNEGEKLTLPECKFTAPEGKQFKAWAIGSKEYDVGDKVTITADTTVKAVWEDIPAVTFTVSFDAGDGTGSMTAVTDVSGEYTLPECTLTAPEGQRFKAWSVNGTEYDAGAKITITADTTIKAVWEDIPTVTYTVSFDAGGGSGTMSAKTVNEGEKLTLPECEFTAPEGQQFKAWAIGSKEYAVGDKATIKANTTVKAVWEDIPVTYTVSFDANGGSGTMEDVTVREGDYTLPENGFTAPEGKEYKAWSISGKEYSPNDVYRVSDDTVVIALWQDAAAELETVATPKLPKEGEFSSRKTITITCATEGADIYYTTDGTRPSTASKLYTGSFTITATTTIKAIAVKAGMKDSKIASATYTKSSGGGGGGGSSDDGDTIRVKMRLIGAEIAKKDVDLGKSSYLPAYVTWIATTSYTLDEGATVYDLFVKATKKAGIRSIGADNNYVETIFAPDSLGGYELSEFTNGKRSDWMYTINGKHPGFGLKDQTLRDGDVVIWHYVNDYSYEVADWTSEGQWKALGDGTYYNGWLKAPDRFGAKSTEEEEEEEENSARFENGVVILEAETDSGTATARLDKETAETGLKKSKDKNQLTVEVENKKASKIVLNVDSDAVKAIADASSALRVETDKGTVTLSSGDMGSLAKNGKDVRIIFEDAADGAEKLSVTVGGKAADVTLYIELSASKGSQVLAVVNDDGSMKVLKKSVVENGKAYAEIPSGATVKVIANKKTFKDVKDSDWFASAVDFASSHELFQGVGNDEFAPKANMTRAMLVTVLYRLQDEPKAGNASFDDVPGDTWYTKAVAWAAEESIVLGVGNDRFAPNDNITREQIATILYRYMKYLGVDVSAKGDLSKFKDGKDVSSWAQEAMLWAQKVGLFQGDDQGNLNPRSNATRAEVATLIQRLVRMLVLK